MNTKNNLNLKLAEEIADLRESKQSLMMSTVSADGMPHASYSPFVFVNGCFFILISDIAQHAKNLKECSKIAVLIIESEEKARNIYARKRMSFDAEAHLVTRGIEHWDEIIQVLFEKFGTIVKNLDKMTDFNLYMIKPSRGRFVKGFGQAFDILGNDEIEAVHLIEGHKQSKESMTHKIEK